ncbi:MAG: DUF2156 domain-containing protein [Clostridia bacterium]|nr:DUF2156 domain-containing protein [Clostridia bacterium]
MEFVSLTLDMRERIDTIRKAYCHTASSHAFVSLYLWRNSMELSVSFWDDAFLVKCENGYFFPCGKEEDVLFLVKTVWENEPDARFFYAREEDKLLCERAFGDAVFCEFDSASREYLYLRSEQIEMKGKKFTYQRAKVNKARRLGEITSCELTESLVPIAKAITEEWAAKREDKGDFAETLEALDNMRSLGMYGNLLYLDGSPIGFNLGSFLSDDSFDIHIAKTLCDDVDTLMKLELYLSLPERVVIINREEDLGIRGLAIHKQDAQPCGFNDTYILSYRKECR